MRVLVTGSTGYVGSVLVPLLERRGHEVLGVDLDLYRGCDFGGPPPEHVRRAVDIRDVTSGDVRGCDAVVHLAGLSNDPLGDLDAALTADVNVGGTVAVAEAARRAGVARFVFASSCSVYGAQGAELVDESAVPHPVTPYADSKLASERFLAALAGPQFEPVALRHATAYGVSPRLRGDLVVNNLTGYAHACGQVVLKSDGSAWRPLVHVADIARAILVVLEAPGGLVRGEVYNVCATEENYQVREVADLVAASSGAETVVVAPGIRDERSYRVDGSKLRRVLPAAVPVRNVRAGITELLDAFRRVGLTVDELEGPRYSRAAFVRAQMDRDVPPLRASAT